MKIKKITLLSLALCGLNSQLWAMRSFKDPSRPSPIEPVESGPRINRSDLPEKPHLLIDNTAMHQEPRDTGSTNTISPKLITSPDDHVTNPGTTTTTVAGGEDSELVHLNTADVTAIRYSGTPKSFLSARPRTSLKSLEEERIALKKQRQARMKKLMENKTFGRLLTELNSLLETARTKSLFPKGNREIDKIASEIDSYLNDIGSRLDNEENRLQGLEGKPESKKFAKDLAKDIEQLEKNIKTRIIKATIDFYNVIPDISGVLTAKATEITNSLQARNVLKEKGYKTWEEAPENVREFHVRFTAIRKKVFNDFLSSGSVKLADYKTMEKLEQELLTALDKAPTKEEAEAEVQKARTLLKQKAFALYDNPQPRNARSEKGYTAWEQTPKNIQELHDTLTNARKIVLRDIQDDSSELSNNLVAMEKAEQELLTALDKAPTLAEAQKAAEKIRLEREPILKRLQAELDEKMNSLSLSPEEKAMLKEKLTKLFNQKVDEGTVKLDNPITQDAYVLSDIKMEAQQISRAAIFKKLEDVREAFLDKLPKLTELNPDQKTTLKDFVHDYITKETLTHYTDPGDWTNDLKEEVSGYINDMIKDKNAVIETANFTYSPTGKKEKESDY